MGHARCLSLGPLLSFSERDLNKIRSLKARFGALALAYIAAKIGCLVSAYWVVSPNPLSTVSLLVTLVNVSAAWAPPPAAPLKDTFLSSTSLGAKGFI